ncbi:enoyl-CoA hydratase/isomerase family protein [Microbulbifer thermotolerans]|uniref:Enoyl-CoA hydratase/isomerase family protein n=1 Tax=Microbulbifer thermotolerans TaxID=252514 RepID=A0A143HIA9_MICTH|nr:enoyl-CoA hydratase/isomerase family protein [Microbulbifer thermotolerans]AMX01454.1 gamma-carboxygeranoyl-CoA hydratase [Microbulbifer thermotolerans]MCX2778295.1 enoyl-CoA hydratase/isomerase family protein [Microbulbifer thermotolerans]MCX2781982.1 enoyl-CoA hydratase/isomerase family protein [Microbulbifer thermotolerans]MCX2783260.1 enoyl-CoA hydratase/isomerase family protein [Microbulbifer thermotolerans]MCX2796312.1 enoyl-CoA hydratase/isomerase family protein [Microbulbifer thermo
MSIKLLTEIDSEGVATVTLNRPEIHNAFDDALIRELGETFDRLSRNPAIRVLVLAANGKSFSAGGDLNWMQRMVNYSEEENRRDAATLAAMLHKLDTFPVPTIARVQGAAFGGGVGLVSCCDIAVASERASFCLSEVKIGLLPATISPYVINAIGARQARRYFVTAERFSAERAREIGLVSEVCAEGELDLTVQKLVNAITDNGPRAVAMSKQLAMSMSNRVITQELQAQTSNLIAAVRVSPEGQEGLNAFLEKRAPKWMNSSEE